MIIKNKGKMFDFITATCNPLGGKCPHDCVYCWSMGEKGLVNRFDMKKYRGDIRLYSKELKRIASFKEGDFVFIQDMSDLFAACVPDRFIYAVLKVIKSSPAKFLLLTKNPERMLNFYAFFPKNVMLGITIESNKDYPEISDAPLQSQRFYWANMLARSMKTDSRKRGIKLFISIEPILDFTDRFYMLLYWLRASLWGVAVGMDNYSNNLPEPELSRINTLIEKLDQFMPRIYLKTLRKKR